MSRSYRAEKKLNRSRKLDPYRRTKLHLASIV